MRLRSAGVAAAMILTLAPVARAGAAAWTFQSVALPTGATTAKLLAVSCWSANGCMAVGYSVDSSAATHTLDEQWDGDAWTVRKTPNRAGDENVLTAVACVTSAACTAVGTFVNAGRTRTLAEAWNGTTWSLQTTVDPSGSNLSVLSGVACSTATACVAVGSYNDAATHTATLGEKWNGTTWTLAKPRNHAGGAADVLSAVACPTPTMCLAVGYFATGSGAIRTSAEVWDGTAWALHDARNLAGATALAGVSCATTSQCVAVGYANDAGGTPRAHAQAWNGTTWIIHSPADPSPVGDQSHLDAVSCLPSGGCLAVGHLSSGDGATALAEGWDGAHWAQQQAGNPAWADASALAGVSCAAAAGCAAVGSALDSSGRYFGLADRFAPSWAFTPHGIPVSAHDTLTSVSCSASDACTAVGYYTNGGTTDATPFALRWDGGSWKLQDVPLPAGPQRTYLYGVSCPTATTCVAVGDYYVSGYGHLFASTWNGASWTSHFVLAPGGALTAHFAAVSCASATECVAVGNATSSTTNAFVAQWNGVGWASLAVNTGTDESDLSGVSCPATEACVAVGNRSTVAGPSVAYAVRQDSSGWIGEDVASPLDASSVQLTGISCVASDACVAVGQYSLGSADGETAFGDVLTSASGWTLSTVPTPGVVAPSLAAVSCSAADACTSVGAADDGPLVERWDGTRFRVQDAPGQPLAFAGVACPVDNSCTAVGTSRPLSTVETWHGSAWKVRGTPHPTGSGRGYLTGVSCVASDDCSAVGWAVDPTGIGVPSAERWNGSRWAVETPRRPAGASDDSALVAVSCQSSGWCMAVGWTDPGSRVPFTEVRSGGTWSVVPAPPGPHGGTLNSVSCSSPTACIAVGAGGGTDLTRLAERWNGSAWTVLDAGSGVGWLTSVSCRAATDCMAVGTHRRGDGTYVALAERWNGAVLSAISAPTPAGRGSQLYAVSCLTDGRCEAVGQQSGGGQPSLSLAEVWDGTKWRIQPTPDWPGTDQSLPLTISCAADDMCIVGGSYSAGGAIDPLAMSWNGVRWVLQIPATPTDISQAGVQGVSCSSTVSCEAVGDVVSTALVLSPLTEQYS